MNHNIELTCSLQNLKQVRDFVSQALTEYCVPDEEVHLIVLAVDEVCANVIIHSNECKDDQSFSINIYKSKEGLTFDITEKGKPFDPASLKEPDISSIISSGRKGGIGLMLVKRIMDSVELTNDSSNTIYRLRKKISPAC